MKKTICSLLCICLLLLLASCTQTSESKPTQRPGSTASSGTSQPNSSGGNVQPPDDGIEFTVTLRCNGLPITENPGFMELFRETIEETGGIYAMWHDGTTLHTAPFDEKGVARITGLDGDYRVNLSTTPGDYYYLVNDQWATNHNPQITIDLYRVLYGDGPGTAQSYPFLKEIDAGYGVYEITISGPDEIVYCRFTPEMVGDYLFLSLASVMEDNVNPMLVVFDPDSPEIVDYIIDDDGPEGIYTKNFGFKFFVTHSDIESGKTIYFGIRATAKDGQYPIKVYFLIDHDYVCSFTPNVQ